MPSRWEIIDEIIFRATTDRNRLILELMARGGMRIGEVLKLKLGDLQDRKLVLREPKSGKEYELEDWILFYSSPCHFNPRRF